VIVIAAVLAMVGGVIVGVVTTHSKSPVNLSAGDCESAAPSQSAAAKQQTTTTRTRTRNRHIGWVWTRHGWRHRPPAGKPSATPSDPADPSAAPSEPADPSAEPSAEPSESAEPSAAPSESAEPSAEPSESAPPCDDQSAEPSASPSASASQPAAQPIGPAAADYVNIRQVQPNVRAPRATGTASRGTFTSNCGVSDHQNTANQVITPGVSDGAHHLHDLVGNTSADGLSTDDSLAASGTSCGNGDQSTYFWPVERIRGANDDPTAAAVQDQNNIGTPAKPTRATIQWRGNPTAKVVAAPRFLKMVVGDAKTITNGLGNAKPTFTCTGFTDRITNKYPLCPRGSSVLSIHDFPSCWDGQNLDSANHRTHLVFPDAASGACPQGTQAVPQLRITLTYNLPARALAFAVDGFATERHDPASDHAGAINVMTDDLMARAVTCINSGRRC
jgi:hypothetical protein